MKRKVLTAVILILIIIIALALTIYLKFGRKVKTGEFIGMKYSPGLYSGMMGGSYTETLMKNENEEWIIEIRNQESRADPILIVIYSVNEEKLVEFVTFLKDKNVAGLSKRKYVEKTIYDDGPGL